MYTLCSVFMSVVGGITVPGRHHLTVLDGTRQASDRGAQRVIYVISGIEVSLLSRS